MEYLFVLPALRLAQSTDCTLRVLATAGTSWRTADAIGGYEGGFAGIWRLEGDTAFLQHPKLTPILAKLECWFSAPHTVEAAEVLSFLPAPGECKYLKDRVFETCSSTESLGVLLAKAAFELGKRVPAITPFWHDADVVNSALILAHSFHTHRRYEAGDSTCECSNHVPQERDQDHVCTRSSGV